MRLEHGGHPLGVLRLGPSQPAQLRHRLRGPRNGPDGFRPGTPPAQRVDEIGRGHLGPPVIAEQGRAHEVALLVQRHHPVLLRRDPDGLHAFEQPAGGRLAEREQPGLRIDLGGLGLDRMGGVPLPEHGARVRVTDDDVSEGGRTVQPRDYAHGEILPHPATYR